jgi:hypothetical protein
MHVDTTDNALPCSYAAMVEQRERYLRTRRGPDRFTYDCSVCQARDHCTSTERQLPKDYKAGTAGPGRITTNGNGW